MNSYDVKKLIFVYLKENLRIQTVYNYGNNQDIEIYLKDPEGVEHLITEDTVFIDD